MNKVSISIVIVNYNTFELTCNCIESIYWKEPSLDFEIILVDNKSTDRMPSEFKTKFPKVILIESPTNVGFAKGNNLGIAHAKGEYILLLNSDTVLRNQAISLSRQFLDENRRVGVVTTRLEYEDGTVQHNCQRFPSIFFKSFELFRVQKIFPSLKSRLFGPFFSYNEVANPDWVWGTFFMFRKDDLYKMKDGKLAEDFFMYVEDMQWCMDFKKLGMKITFIPTGQVTHFMGKSQGAKNEWMVANHEKFMEKYYSYPHRKMIQVLDVLLKFSVG